MSRSIIPALGLDAQRQVRAQLSVPSLTKASEALAGEKTNKYHNVRTKVGELWFDSKREAERWQELCLLQRAGQISRLEAHPKFPLAVNGVDLGRYTPDFIYYEAGKGQTVEDVKGGKATQTAASKIKIKLFEAIYSQKVRIVT